MIGKYGYGVLWILIGICLPIQADEIARFTIDRPGAGPAAGWKAEHESCTVQPASSAGPFGIGAAQIAFEKKGVFRWTAPACKLPPDQDFSVYAWVRTDMGAQIAFRLLDNDYEDGPRLETSLPITGEWQCLSMKGKIPPSVKGFYYLTLQITGGAGTVWLDGIYSALGVPPDTPPIRPAGLVMTPEAPWGVSAGTTPLAVNLHTVGVTRPDARIRLNALHTDGSYAAFPPIAMDGGGVWSGRWILPETIAAPYGMIRLTGMIEDNEGKALSAKSEILLAHAPQPIPGPRPDSPFGIHVSLKESDVTAVAQLGYKWCRIHDASNITKWGIVEPTPNQWKFFDEEVAMVRRHGLSILGMFDSAPLWESGAEDSGYFSIYHAPKNIDHWRAYVRQMAGHYAGAIDAWEVWNEPWDMGRFFQGGNPLLYADLLKAAYTEAKALNPNSTIVGIDTYPALWEQAVLLNDVLPYYDLVSWHRYDPNLAGRPNDNIERVTRRIEAAQATYGAPKPTLCSEGGIDTTLFQGSFFSFADPDLNGDWSEGADRYSRFYLSAIAAGNKRVITYSAHNEPRFGQPTHMMLEPGRLIRPLHAALAGLAHFIEGAFYEERLIPARDISAHLFRQPEKRDFSDGPSWIAVLHADGEIPEDLPKPLPASVKAYDRFGNPCPPPTQATRSLQFLVAGDADKAALAEALTETPPESLKITDSLEGLLPRIAEALIQPEPRLWPLFSAQATVAVCMQGDKVIIADRDRLRKDPQIARCFTLPADAVPSEYHLYNQGLLGMASFRMKNAVDHRYVQITATPEGKSGAWRILALTLLEEKESPDPAEKEICLALMKRWETAFHQADTRALHGLYTAGPCCLTTHTLNGEYLVFSKPEQLITMTNTAVLWGPSAQSEMAFDNPILGDRIAVFTGAWAISSLAFGAGTYPVTATLVKESDSWKLAHIGVGAPEISALTQMISLIQHTP